MKLTPPKVKAAPDPRHKPFIDFCFETFRDHTGTTLIITSRDAKAVSDMLKATAAHAEEYSLERLQQMWYRYLNNRTAFEMQQEPLRWFCGNLNRYAANGNGKREAVDVQREWLKWKLGK